jgi:hypothetical protein
MSRSPVGICAELLAAVRHREGNSQLLSLSDAAYEAGLRRIERDIDNPQRQASGTRRPSLLCHVARREGPPEWLSNRPNSFEIAGQGHPVQRPSRSTRESPQWHGIKSQPEIARD